MIIKIVHHATVSKRGVRGKGGEVVPKREVLIDGVDEAQYERVACHSAVELWNLVHEFSSGEATCYGPDIESVDQAVDPPAFEAVLIQALRGNVHECLVAVDASVFFMNENGKTVDKVVCQ